MPSGADRSVLERIVVDPPALPRSPFASASWEPRFVVEHYEPAAMADAMGLWLLCAGEHRLDHAPRIRHVFRGDAVLYVAHPSSDPGHWPLEWATLPEPLGLAALRRYALDWLKEARYPDMPSFDGGEAAGFCVFWAHYRCEEVPSGVYGPLVVLPKWFEIHK